METVIACPLGHTCEQVVGGKVHRCGWYTRLEGKDPQGSAIIKEDRCAMNWIPILLVENSMFSRQTGAAVESLRNNLVKEKGEMETVLRKLMTVPTQKVLSTDKD